MTLARTWANCRPYFLVDTSRAMLFQTTVFVTPRVGPWTVRSRAKYDPRQASFLHASGERLDYTHVFGKLYVERCPKTAKNTRNFRTTTVKWHDRLRQNNWSLRVPFIFLRSSVLIESTRVRLLLLILILHRDYCQQSIIEAWQIFRDLFIILIKHSLAINVSQ